MNCNIHVYLLNDHFSQEHADTHHQGKESENNLKYEWEDEIDITSNVTEIKVHEDAVYPLQGELPDGESFSYEIERMVLFEIHSIDSPPTFVGASRSIISSWKQDLIDGKIRLQIFLKDFEPMANPVPGIYIASKEFPKALIF